MWIHPKFFLFCYLTSDKDYIIQMSMPNDEKILNLLKNIRDKVKEFCNHSGGGVIVKSLFV